MYDIQLSDFCIDTTPISVDPRCPRKMSVNYKLVGLSLGLSLSLRETRARFDDNVIIIIIIIIIRLLATRVFVLVTCNT